MHTWPVARSIFDAPLERKANERTKSERADNMNKLDKINTNICEINNCKCNIITTVFDHSKIELSLLDIHQLSCLGPQAYTLLLET